jgi:hypothetical protein
MTILGIVLATVVGTGLSIFVLIGSQGMDSSTPILPAIEAYVPMPGSARVLLLRSTNDITPAVGSARYIATLMLPAIGGIPGLALAARR